MTLRQFIKKCSSFGEREKGEEKEEEKGCGGEKVCNVCMMSMI